MILVSDFCYTHNIAETAVSASKCLGNHLSAYALIGGRSYVNEEYFTKRREFHNTAKMFTQDMYYLLIENSTEAEIARQACGHLDPEAMSVFLNSRLFSLNSKSIIDNKMSVYAWKFWKYCKTEERRLKHLDPTFDVGKSLDLVTRLHERRIIR